MKNITMPFAAFQKLQI